MLSWLLGKLSMLPLLLRLLGMLRSERTLSMLRLLRPLSLPPLRTAEAPLVAWALVRAVALTFPPLLVVAEVRSLPSPEAPRPMQPPPQLMLPVLSRPAPQVEVVVVVVQGRSSSCTPSVSNSRKSMHCAASVATHWL